jgi:Uma2 family endonuclease
MEESQAVSAQSTASGEDIERYEVIDGVRVEREPMGAFETVLASWLCHLMNSVAAGKKLGLAVNEVLFVLNAARTLQRRPGVAFVSYAHWPTSVVAREPAWNVVPDLAIEIVSPTNLKDCLRRIACTPRTYLGPSGGKTSLLEQTQRERFARHQC